MSTTSASQVLDDTACTGPNEKYATYSGVQLHEDDDMTHSPLIGEDRGESLVHPIYNETIRGTRDIDLRHQPLKRDFRTHGNLYRSSR